MQHKTLTLGGVEYTVQELPARKNAAWRKGLEAQLGPFLNLVEQAGAGAEIRKSEDLMQIVNQVGHLLVTAPDTMIELIFSYASNLDAKRETILDNAYDSELTAAFVAVLGLAYPFGGLVMQLAQLARAGSPTTPMMTSKNSPSANGVSLAKPSMNSAAPN